MAISAVLLVVLSVGGCGGDEPPQELLCQAGAYRLDDGELLALTPSDGDTLRYRLFSGRSGRLHPDGAGRFVSGDGWSVREPVTLVVTLANCGEGRITLDPLHGEPVVGRRLPLRESEVAFEGRGVRLHGKLVLPEGEPRAIAVLGHGSEDWAATAFYAWQYLLPPAGIGVFLFDKRGTGASEGEYTQDFDLLADDLAAAAREARSLVGPTPPLGFLAGSQGGWVAPLAASREPVDFVAVGYGIVESPLAEDRGEVLSNLRRAGYGPEVLAKAREVTDATGAIMASGFREGYDALEVPRRALVGAARGRVHAGHRQVSGLGVADRRPVVRPWHAVGLRPPSGPGRVARTRYAGPLDRRRRGHGGADGGLPRDPSPPAGGARSSRRRDLSASRARHHRSRGTGSGAAPAGAPGRLLATAGALDRDAQPRGFLRRGRAPSRSGRNFVAATRGTRLHLNATPAVFVRDNVRRSPPRGTPA